MVWVWLYGRFEIRCNFLLFFPFLWLTLISRESLTLSCPTHVLIGVPHPTHAWEAVIEHSHPHLMCVNQVRNGFKFKCTPWQYNYKLWHSDTALTHWCSLRGSMWKHKQKRRVISLFLVCPLITVFFHYLRFHEGKFLSSSPSESCFSKQTALIYSQSHLQTVC